MVLNFWISFFSWSRISVACMESRFSFLVRLQGLQRLQNSCACRCQDKYKHVCVDYKCKYDSFVNQFALKLVRNRLRTRHRKAFKWNADNMCVS